MKKFLLLTVCVAMVTMMLAQTQKGYVKTKGRLGADGQLIPGEPLGEVTVKVKDRNAVMSDKRGDFSFPMPDETFYLESVTKSGYVMIDPEMLSKQYSYSKNKLVIALETRENQLEERMDMNEKIMRAQRELIDKLRAEVKQLKADNKITEEEYYKRLQEIVDMQNENRRLVEDMVEHYSKIDYDDMNEFDRLFSSYLLNGDVRKADSLVNSKGDLHQRADEYYQLREANAKAREDLDKRRKKLEKSEATAIKMRDDLASDYYKKFEILKMQHKNDSAAYWLEERVKLDTTNVEWIIYVGDFIRRFIANYDEVLKYYMMGLRQAKLQGGDNSPEVAMFYHDLGRINEVIANYDEAQEYYEKALAIRLLLFGEKSYYVAQSYDEMGVLYADYASYDKALEYINKALLIWLDILGEENSNIAVAYCNMAMVYGLKGEYDKALEFYNKALVIAMKVYGEEPEEVGTIYNNMSYVYYDLDEGDIALEYLNKALSIWIKVYGKEHPTVAGVYGNIGIMYIIKGDYDKALEYSNKSLLIRLNVYGENHPDVALSYNGIGGVYHNLGDYDEALKYYIIAMNIRENIYNNDNPNLAISYSNIGQVYNQIGDYDKAKEYCNKALNVFKQTLGDDHPYTQRAVKTVSEIESKLAESNKKK